LVPRALPCQLKEERFAACQIINHPKRTGSHEYTSQLTVVLGARPPLRHEWMQGCLETLAIDRRQHSGLKSLDEGRSSSCSSHVSEFRKAREIHRNRKRPACFHSTRELDLLLKRQRVAKRDQQL